MILAKAECQNPSDDDDDDDDQSKVEDRRNGAASRNKLSRPNDFVRRSFLLEQHLARLFSLAHPDWATDRHINERLEAELMTWHFLGLAFSRKAHPPEGGLSWSVEIYQVAPISF